MSKGSHGRRTGGHKLLKNFFSQKGTQTPRSNMVEDIEPGEALEEAPFSPSLHSETSLDSHSQAKGYSPDAVLLGKFKSLLQSELAATAKSITTQVMEEIKEIGHRTDTLESKTGHLIHCVNEHDTVIEDLQAQLTALQEKAEDSENRSRRNNRPSGFNIGSSIVPELPLEHLELDRVHRALGPKTASKLPKDIIVRLHYYATKELIMGAACTKDDLSYQGHKFQLFADLATSTIAKRKGLKPLTTILLQHEVRYRWAFPVKLLFMYENKYYDITSLQEGSEVLQKLGLMEAGPTVPSADVQSPNRSLRSPRPISPIWSSVRSRRR
ncbi:hypothetical protein XELAEV_18024802mg [Xenopus laevis]|uniref:Uncharacterized protein n=1 Tax=Xenopus laevis TaxID=8355 RepID=A0A974CZL1_XENLA|nr:hypothetical protein XELAEV_18024802mg [Xenopus laevis]